MTTVMRKAELDTVRTAAELLDAEADNLKASGSVGGTGELWTYAEDLELFNRLRDTVLALYELYYRHGGQR